MKKHIKRPFNTMEEGKEHGGLDHKVSEKTVSTAVSEVVAPLKDWFRE